MSDISRIQAENKEWAWRNFGDAEAIPPWQPLLGAVEEIGELAHAYLKRHQGIRVNEDHDEAIKDAIGDIVIYLMDFCNRQNLDLELCVINAWEEVKQRDWNKHREEGKRA